MKVDKTKVLEMVDADCKEGLTVLVKKGSRACCPDAVYERANPHHAVHLGISVETDIIIYGMIKAHSLRFDRIPNDQFDRWFPVSLGDFELVTQDWTRRSGYVGDQFDYHLGVLKNQDYLRIALLNGEISLVWTPKLVLGILKAVGIGIDMNCVTTN